MEIKQHTLKQPVYQKGNHKGNLKILGDRRKWQPTPVFLPKKSQEPGRLQSVELQRVGHGLLTV